MSHSGGGPPDKIVPVKRDDYDTAQQFADALSALYQAGFEVLFPPITWEKDVEVYLGNYKKS